MSEPKAGGSGGSKGASAGRAGRGLAAAAALGAALGVASPCRAQANHRPTPVGGRSILMGGTGVALARDGSAPFLNPATMVRITDRRIAFSVNVYALSVTNLSNWYRPTQPYLSGVAAVPGERTSGQDIAFDGLPSTLCLFLLEPPRGDAAAGVAPEAADEYARPPRARAGTKKLAVCFGNAERREFGLFDDERQGGGGGTSLQTSSTIQRWRRYVLGPSFAYALDDRFVVGGSLFAQYGVFRGLWSSNAWVDDGAGGSAVTSFDHLARGREFSVTGSLGATYRAGDVTFGLNLALPTISLSGVASAHRFVRTAQAETLAWSASGRFVTRMPWRLSLGAGYERGRTTYELNAGLSAPVERAYRARLDGAVAAAAADGGLAGSQPFGQSDSERARPTANLSVGVEHFVGQSISVLAGAGTDFSAVPADTFQRYHAFPFFTDRTSRATLSAGLGSYGPGGELLGGFEFDYGWGSRLGVDSFRDSPDFAVARQRSYSLLFVLSGSQSVRALRRAIQDVQKAVEGKK